MLPANYKASSENLKFLYSCASHGADANDVVRNSACYYHSLTEAINDKILAARLIAKNLVQAPPTLGERGVKLLIGALGCVAPGAELLNQAYTHLPHILEPITHLGKELGELALEGHEAHEASHHGHTPAFSQLHGAQNDIFIACLSKELAFRFKHELSLLSMDDCLQLVTRHYTQIFLCLDTLAEQKRSLSPKEIFKELINYIDPYPKVAITEWIEEYVKRRHSRYFRSNSQNRELFLQEFRQNMEKNASIDNLLVQLSQRVKFRDDWIPWAGEGTTLAEENAALSLNNRFIRILHADTDRNAELLKIWTFNNPFWSLPLRFFDDDFSLKELFQGILPQLLRLKVMKSINIKDDLEGKATRLEELAFASPLDEMPSASSLDRVGDRTTAPAKEMEPPQPVEYRALDASDIGLMCKMPMGASPDIEPERPVVNSASKKVAILSPLQIDDPENVTTAKLAPLPYTAGINVSEAMTLGVKGQACWISAKIGIYTTSLILLPFINIGAMFVNCSCVGSLESNRLKLLALDKPEFELFSNLSSHETDQARINLNKHKKFYLALCQSTTFLAWLITFEQDRYILYLMKEGILDIEYFKAVEAKYSQWKKVAMYGNIMEYVFWDEIGSFCYYYERQTKIA